MRRTRRAQLSEPVTITTLAGKLGLSVCTVNKALYGKPRISAATARRVRKMAAALGYRPNLLARALARPALSIGLVYPDAWPSHIGLLIGAARASLERLRERRVQAWLRPIPEGDPAAFLAALTGLVADKVSGLILCLSAYAPAALRQAWQMLESARIPFILLGSNFPDGPQLCSVWHDCRRCGRMAAEVLGWLAPGRPLGVFIGRRGLLDHDLKVAGFRGWVRHSRQVLAGIGETHDDPARGYPAARDFFRQHPDVRGIYIGTENAAGICRYLKESGLSGKVKVVATGASDEVARGLAGGGIQCSINQQQPLQGRLAASILYDYLEAGRAPQAAEILVTPELILQNTLNKVLENIGAESGD